MITRPCVLLFFLKDISKAFFAFFALILFPCGSAFTQGLQNNAAVSPTTILLSNTSTQLSAGSVGGTITAVLPGGAQMDFVYIGPGTFTMGSPNNEVGRYSNEGPQHQVTISKGFYLGKYEVTQGQWEAVMGSNPSNFKGTNRPIETVSWNVIQLFIHKLNVAAGDSLYRLPTEAEWEYACRAGSTTRWSFGDDESKLGDYAWYYGNFLRSTQDVGIKLPNPWGLYDMHGNVWEWCGDWYGPYGSSAQIDPQGLSSEFSRVIRGGGFGAGFSGAYVNAYGAPGVRSAYRTSHLSSDSDSVIGFRLLMRAISFEIGSTVNEVKSVQGEPTSITEIGSGTFWYHYGTSQVNFANNVVVGFDNTGNLNVDMGSAVQGATFGLGASSNDVIRAQGTPRKVTYIGSGTFWYHYVTSQVNFANSTVVGYENNGALNVNLGSAISGVKFLIGATPSNVIEAQGTPQKVTYIGSGTFWYHYGTSQVNFSNNVVVGYENNGALNVDLGSAISGAKFQIGATPSNVIEAQGTPQKVTYIGSGTFWYHYGTSQVNFSNNVVVGYENNGNLNVDLGSAISGAKFQIGATPSNVIEAQGTPQKVTYIGSGTFWYHYGTSQVNFSGGMVASYNNAGELKIGVSEANTQESIVDPFTYIGSFNGHTYLLSRDIASWQEAKIESEKAGGYLVTITSEGENSFLALALKRYTRKIWMGYTDQVQEGVWEWITKEPNDFLGWSEGEPNNQGNEDYGIFDSGKWNDGVDTSINEKLYVVEIENGFEEHKITTNWKWAQSGIDPNVLHVNADHTIEITGSAVHFVNTDAVFDRGSYGFDVYGNAFKFAWRISPQDSLQGTGLVLQTIGNGVLELIHVSWSGSYYAYHSAGSFRNSLNVTLIPNVWNRVEIRDTGKTIEVFLNGERQNFFGSNQTAASEFLKDVGPGYVGIAAEPTSAQFRNLIFAPMTVDTPNFALRFDGIDDVAIFDRWFTSGEARYTFSAWVKILGPGNGDFSARSILLHRAAYNDVFIGYYEPDGKLFSRMLENRLILPFRYELNKWFHLAAIYDGTYQIIYINGKEIARRAVDTSQGIVNWEKDYMGSYLGGDRDNWGGHANIEIDNVGIWQTGLTEQEIQSVVLGKWDEVKTNPIAFYTFDEGAGQQVLNQVGKNNNGLLGKQENADSADPEWIVSTVPQDILTYIKNEQILGWPPNVSQTEIPFPADLKFWLAFNRLENGSLIDSGPSKLTGRIDGGALSEQVPRPQPNNQSLVLQTEQENASFDHHASLSFSGSFSISGYVKIPSSDADVVMLGKLGNGVVNYILVIENGKPVFQVADSKSGTVKSEASLSLNDWHHIAGVRDVSQKSLRLYVDGKLVQESADPTSDQIVNTGPVFLGSAKGLTKDQAILLDDVQLYAHALSDSEITQLSSRIVQAPLVHIQDKNLDFGLVAAGGISQKKLSVVNLGDSELHFQLLATSGFSAPSQIFSLSPGDSIDIEISFAPKSIGHLQGTLELSSNDLRGVREVVLTGNGVAAPALITIPADSIVLSKAVAVGKSDTLHFLIKNTGVGSLLVSRMAVDPNVFQLLTDNLTLAEGQDTTVAVVFTPDQSLDYRGVIELTSNALGAPVFRLPIRASGRFLPGIVLAPNTRLVFTDTIGVGDTDVRSVVVKNNGLGMLAVQRIVVDHSAFVFSDTTFSVAPNDSMRITVRFAPPTPDVAIGTAHFLTNDPEKLDVSLQIQGQGAKRPVLRVLPATIDFGTLGVGRDSLIQFTLENLGDVELRIDRREDIAIKDEPPFILDPATFPIVLRKGESKRLGARFRPTPAFFGISTSELRIWSNDHRRQPLIIPLKGRAVAIGAPPEVSISTPADSTIMVWNLESRQTFSGTALNGDGGRIDSLVWASNRDGVLHATNQADKINFDYPIKNLSIGYHTITLRVWDTEGDSASTPVSIQVVGKPPIATIDTARIHDQNFLAENRVVFALLGTDEIAFFGHGVDQDEFGNEITGHLWTFSAIEDQSIAKFPLSDKQNFQIPARRLGSGTFWVYYQVTDNESQQSAADSIKVIIRQDVGRAIIVAGGGYLGENREAFYNYTSSVTNWTYSMLTQYRRYSQEAIEYLNPIQDWGAVYDNEIRVTSTELTKEQLKLSLEKAEIHNVEDRVPLLIFLAGHGGDGIFYLSDDEVLPASQFKGWLNDLNDRKIKQRKLSSVEEIFSGEVVIVVDFCFSRTFLQDVAGPGRIVIGSSSSTVASVIKGRSFGSFFFEEVAKGKNILTSFESARERIKSSFDQEPFMDVNGDGIPLYTSDGKRNAGTEKDEQIARNVHIGGEFINLSPAYPEIYTLEVMMLQQNHYKIRVESDPELLLDYVLIPNDFDPQVKEFADLASGKLIKKENSGTHTVYESEALSIIPGEFTIVVQGKNGLDHVVGHRSISMKFNQGKTGDFTNDGQVGFADFLQFAPHFGQRASTEGWDVAFDLDGDGEIGFTDFLIFAAVFGK